MYIAWSQTFHRHAQDSITHCIQCTYSLDDAVMQWGAVERQPGQYDWSGYQELFTMVKAKGLRIQAVMSFHACGGNVGDYAQVPLPDWVLKVNVKEIALSLICLVPGMPSFPFPPLPASLPIVKLWHS